MRISLWSVGLIVLLTPLAAAGGETNFSAGLMPWLNKNCVTCHNSKKSSGGVDFSGFKDQAAAKARFDVWKKAVEQVRTGNMPPDEPLDAKSKQPLVGWYDATFDTSKNPDPGPPLMRQLTRNEYSQTMRDLFRFYFDPAGEAGIPHENVVTGFPNRANGLVLESSLMERYFTAADLALDRLFTDPGTKGPRTAVLVVTPSAKVSAAEASRQVLRASHASRFASR